MRKLVVSVFALAVMTTVAMAGERVKLTSSQFDQVSRQPVQSFKMPIVQRTSRSRWRWPGRRLVMLRVAICKQRSAVTAPAFNAASGRGVCQGEEPS